MKYTLTWNTATDNMKVVYRSLWDANKQMQTLVEQGIAFTLIAR